MLKKKKFAKTKKIPPSVQAFFKSKQKQSTSWNFPTTQPLKDSTFPTPLKDSTFPTTHNQLNKYKFKSKETNFKRNVNGAKKRIVAASQKWRCQDCSNLLSACYQVDHIIRLDRGGTNDISNLQALCAECHGLKTMWEMAEVESEFPSNS